MSAQPDLPRDGGIWKFLREFLLGLRGFRICNEDKEDLVQDSLVRVLTALGPTPADNDARALGRHVLQAILIDALRRKRPVMGALDEDAISSKDGEDPEDAGLTRAQHIQTYFPMLAEDLGPKGIALLEAILSGTSENKRLARSLATDPKSIRQRRKRLLRVLEKHARLADDIGRSPPPNGIQDSERSAGSN